MRALLVVEQLRRPVPGGIGRYAEGLVGGLTGVASRGAEDGDASPLADVRLLASRPPHRGADPLARWGVPVLASSLPGPLLTRAWDLGAVAAPTDEDVVHAVSLAAPRVRRGRGAPALVVTVHDLAHRDPATTTRRGRRWHEAALRRALRRADALVAPSAGVAAELVASGARDGTVSVIEWGADHLPPPDLPAARDLLERLGVSGPYLLSASTLEPRKNLRRLIAAYGVARPSLPEPWPLVIVGPRGWGHDEVGVAAASTEGVVAAGLVSDGVLAGLYEGARAFAYVALAEGYGLPPVEAMGLGVPVVASTAVPSALPARGEAPPALRVDPTSIEAIADALVSAACDEEVRATLVERGRRHVRSRRWRETAAHHVDLWASLR